jgi:hypothetical protein
VEYNFVKAATLGHMQKSPTVRATKSPKTPTTKIVGLCGLIARSFIIFDSRVLRANASISLR